MNEIILNPRHIISIPELQECHYAWNRGLVFPASCRPFARTKVTIGGIELGVWYEWVGRSDIVWRAILLEPGEQYGMVMLHIGPDHKVVHISVSSRARRRQFWKTLINWVVSQQDNLYLYFPGEMEKTV